jgi:hypothetical protein
MTNSLSQSTYTYTEEDARKEKKAIKALIKKYKAKKNKRKLKGEK